ncbi:hypothetical protein yinte0001_37550 [Yersinia intermedia ATCC 29909]|nr:hypothetical protein yinte0001_37550 [Yersinia intermedia ATCC 29909]
MYKLFHQIKYGAGGKIGQFNDRKMYVILQLYDKPTELKQNHYLSLY